MPWEAVQRHMLERLHERGFDDLDAAHLNVFQYPGPQGARPSELAARLRISKQALNYLLGELERLGYLERRPDPDDLRSKRIALTARGISAIARDPRGRRRDGDRLGAAARPETLRPTPQPPARAQPPARNPRLRPSQGRDRSTSRVASGRASTRIGRNVVPIPGDTCMIVPSRA